MKSHASLALVTLVASLPAAAQSGRGASYLIPGQADAPQASSDRASGDRRFDEVGQADVGGGEGVTAIVAGLAPGEYVEVTAIDTGKTIVVAVANGEVAARRLATLSQGAAAKLGVRGEPIAVRIRRVVATGADVASLRAGIAAERSDTPPVLLTALRRKLGVPAARAERPRPPGSRPKAPVAKPKPAGASRGAAASGYYIQVAALADAARAANLATRLGGTTAPAGTLTRVQIGPFADQAAASRKRAEAVRMGYPGALIVRINP